MPITTEPMVDAVDDSAEVILLPAEPKPVFKNAVALVTMSDQNAVSVSFSRQLASQS